MFASADQLARDEWLKACGHEKQLNIQTIIPFIGFADALGRTARRECKSSDDWYRRSMLVHLLALSAV